MMCCNYCNAWHDLDWFSSFWNLVTALYSVSLASGHVLIWLNFYTMWLVCIASHAAACSVINDVNSCDQHLNSQKAVLSPLLITQWINLVDGFNQASIFPCQDISFPTNFPQKIVCVFSVSAFIHSCDGFGWSQSRIGEGSINIFIPLVTLSYEILEICDGVFSCWYINRCVYSRQKYLVSMSHTSCENEGLSSRWGILRLSKRHSCVTFPLTLWRPQNWLNKIVTFKASYQRQVKKKLWNSRRI